MGQICEVTMKIWIVLFLSCLSLMAEAPPPRVVVVEKVDYHDISRTAPLIGTVKAQSEAVLTAQTSGTVVQKVGAGDSVKRGDLLAYLDNKDLLKNHDLAVNAEQLAKQQYDRAATLTKSGTVSQKALETLQNDWLTAQKVASDAKIELEKTQFRAPFDGVVGVFKVREGGQMTSGGILVTLYDPSSLVIDLEIPELILPFIQKGQPLFVQDKRLSLTAVQRIIDPETHMAPASAPYQCDACVIGANIAVNLVVEEKKHVLTVPVDALTLRDEKTFVFVVKDKKAQLRPVKIGLREKDRIEVVEGVEAGELVIKEKASIHDGSDVRVAENA